MSRVLNRRDQKRPLISRVKDLPDFDEMGEDEIVDWWETHDVTAEVMDTFPEGDLEEDLRWVGLDPEAYLKSKS